MLEAAGGLGTMALDILAGEMVRLTSHKTLSGDMVGRRLNELVLKLWQEKMWCIKEVVVWERRRNAEGLASSGCSLSIGRVRSLAVPTRNLLAAPAGQREPVRSSAKRY